MGQGRIITVAGNSSSGNATGEMILGTRRYFNKVGSGTQWYYGNDIVIDGNGNVGIGTTNPQGYLLAVAGSAIATSMTVKLYANWPDYVFKKDYQLPTLTEVKAYIEQFTRDASKEASSPFTDPKASFPSLLPTSSRKSIL